MLMTPPSVDSSGADGGALVKYQVSVVDDEILQLFNMEAQLLTDSLIREFLSSLKSVLLSLMLFHQALKLYYPLHPDHHQPFRLLPQARTSGTLIPF